jgi:SAM-dependent methyltransferase
MERHAHWETVYSNKSETEVSWYQPSPDVSLQLISKVSAPHARVIDVGGGASTLVDHLLERDLEAVAVLDISPVALEKAKTRLGERAAKVRWIVADVTAAPEIGEFDVWHDRAVFHFLTEARDRQAYVELATRSVRAGGHVIIGTFALDGPDRCSGLAVRRYDATALQAELGAGFSLVEEIAETHLTPWGKPQQFVYGLFRRNASSRSVNTHE